MKEVNSDRDVIYRMSHVMMAVQLTALTEVPTSGLNVETKTNASLFGHQSPGWIRPHRRVNVVDSNDPDRVEDASGVSPSKNISFSLLEMAEKMSEKPDKAKVIICALLHMGNQMSAKLDQVRSITRARVKDLIFSVTACSRCIYETRCCGQGV